MKPATSAWAATSGQPHTRRLQLAHDLLLDGPTYASAPGRFEVADQRLRQTERRGYGGQEYSHLAVAFFFSAEQALGAEHRSRQLAFLIRSSSSLADEGAQPHHFCIRRLSPRARLATLIAHSLAFLLPAQLGACSCVECRHGFEALFQIAIPASPRRNLDPSRARAETTSRSTPCRAGMRGPMQPHRSRSASAASLTASPRVASTEGRRCSRTGRAACTVPWAVTAQQAWQLRYSAWPLQQLERFRRNIRWSVRLFVLLVALSAADPFVAMLCRFARPNARASVSSTMPTIIFDRLSSDLCAPTIHEAATQTLTSDNFEHMSRASVRPVRNVPVDVPFAAACFSS